MSRITNLKGRLSIEQLLSKSPDETHKLGYNLATRLRAGDTVALSGEMGCGKTILIKGICQGLGYTEDVTSPSFTHVHHYHGKIDILHVDLFLDGSEGSVLDLGLDEYMGGNFITLIEWADRFPSTLPEKCWRIKFEHVYDQIDCRNITIFPLDNKI